MLNKKWLIIGSVLILFMIMYGVALRVLIYGNKQINFGIFMHKLSEDQRQAWEDEWKKQVLMNPLPILGKYIPQEDMNRLVPQDMLDSFLRDYTIQAYEYNFSFWYSRFTDMWFFRTFSGKIWLPQRAYIHPMELNILDTYILLDERSFNNEWFHISREWDTLTFTFLVAIPKSSTLVPISEQDVNYSIYSSFLQFFNIPPIVWTRENRYVP